MGEREGAPSPDGGTPAHCEECRQNPWKYRCPGCSLRTCSLSCVKSHKHRTGCTGQRNRTQFVPLSQFDDNQLLSDYNFLEETKMVAESARRVRASFGGQPGGMGHRPGGFGGQSGFKLPFKLRMLRNAVFRRKARLLLLPAGMSKREKNQSRYDQRMKSIFWTIEWRFHSTNVILTDHSVDERTNLISIMGKHLKASPWNHQLRPFCNEELDNLKFFLQRNPKDSNSPFRQLNARVPIGQQMSNVTIVEYPVILVFLPTHSCGFEVEVDGSLHHNNARVAEKLDDQPSPKGSLFRVEEPEDTDASSDTRILDLMDYTNAAPGDKFRVAKDSSSPPHQTTGTRSDVEVPGSVAETSMPASGINNHACGVEKANEYLECSEDPLKFSISTDFDFEQDLRDAYSDLIGEINPDDFLCLDGGYGEECGGEAGKETGEYGGALVDTELEEGEIPNY